MAATALVAVGCVMPRSPAARLKLPVSTTRMKSCTPVMRSMAATVTATGTAIPPRNSSYPLTWVHKRVPAADHCARPDKEQDDGEDEGRHGGGAGDGEGRREPGFRRARR